MHLNLFAFEMVDYFCLTELSSEWFRGYVWLSIQYFLGLIWAYLDQIKPWVLSWLFYEWSCPCLFGSIYTILRESWNFDSSPLILFDWCLSYSSDWSLGCMLMSAGCQYLLHLEFLCCCGLRVLFGFSRNTQDYSDIHFMSILMDDPSLLSWSAWWSFSSSLDSICDSLGHHDKCKQYLAVKDLVVPPSDEQ